MRLLKLVIKRESLKIKAQIYQEKEEIENKGKAERLL